MKRTRTLDETLVEDVKAIVGKVVEDGDKALINFAQMFDKATLNIGNLKVTKNEIKAAYRKVKGEQIAALKLMKDKIGSFERRSMEKLEIQTSKEGIAIRGIQRPIESVGCYVPGGQAAYPSTVVMTAIPAKIAGVPRIVMCTPPNAEGTVNPLVLVAADICGINEVFKVGGAQAIAALAYGTETIKCVKKIVGPGNKYVTLAKILVSKDVAIDMPAGPSEILVLGDETSDPKLVALDMVSQAEHGADSIAGLITTSKQLAEEVAGWLEKLATNAERSPIVNKAIAEQGFIVICDKKEEIIDLANAFAPEHVEIMTESPMEIAIKITSAGIILLGTYSPVALSDYGIGTNHVLPTGGFGHAFSGLSVHDFMRRVYIVEGSREGLHTLKNHVKTLTETENLPNHYKAIEARLRNENAA